MRDKVAFLLERMIDSGPAAPLAIRVGAMRDEMEIFVLSTVPGKKPLTVLTMTTAPATLSMVPAITATTTATSLCCSATVQVALVVRNLPADANQGDIRDEDLIPGLGRSPGTGNGDPLQYSRLENPMDRGAWRATVHWVAKSRTRLK